MKCKGIIIELTALLDVIFIMLFWTMNNTQQIQSEAETKVVEAEQLVSLSQEECEKVRKEAESEVRRAWKITENINKTAADNQKALDGFRSGEVITISIVQDSVQMSDNIKTFYSGDITESCVVNGLFNAEKNVNDVILCSFVYDGSTVKYADVQTINLAITSAEKEYPNFYCTRINISERKELR